MTEELMYASYQVFRAPPAQTAVLDRDVATKEVSSVLDEHAGGVRMRGAYSTSGFTAAADMMLWWIARSADDVQRLLVEFRHTRLGRSLDLVASYLGIVRPAEFTRDHLPAFAAGRDPKRYLCVYPFVRTPEWYLLEPAERGRMLKEHGEAARQYPDVQANTTSAFGLNDYEWILAFEADGPDRIVDLIRHLRATEARRYTKVEIPFFTGIRKDLAQVVEDLP
jgi:hydrogen peroxide-dependent heme synthase